MEECRKNGSLRIVDLPTEIQSKKIPLQTKNGMTFI
jgi:hypothetical protein